MSKKYISNITGVLMMKGKPFKVEEGKEINCTEEEFEPSKAVRIEEIKEEKPKKASKKAKKEVK